MRFIKNYFRKKSQNAHLAPQRPLRWEEEIALHHDSSAPFDTVARPADIDLAEYQSSYMWKKLGLDDEQFLRYRDADAHPMPSTEDREGYNRGADRDYFINGLSDYLMLQQASDQYALKAQSYLDFGCASGRVLRHFAAHSDIEELWGADINGRHIKFIQQYLPAHIKAMHTSAIPYLPIADGSIDLLSAFSVFTHIDTFESAWLAEIYRVMSDDALCYLTIHNDDTWQNMWQEGERKFLYAHLERATQNIDELAGKSIPAGRTSFRHTEIGPYRALTFHSNDYIEQNWGRFFEILEIRPFAHGRNQAVVIAKKK